MFALNARLIRGWNSEFRPSIHIVQWRLCPRKSLSLRPYLSLELSNFTATFPRPILLFPALKTISFADDDEVFLRRT